MNQVKEINGTEFLDYLKGTHKARYVSKKEEIVNLIYSNDINSEENGRFALVPISPNNFKFENMKSIVKLAFNIDMLHEDGFFRKEEEVLNAVPTNGGHPPEQ